MRPNIMLQEAPNAFVEGDNRINVGDFLELDTGIQPTVGRLVLIDDADGDVTTLRRLQEGDDPDGVVGVVIAVRVLFV